MNGALPSFKIRLPLIPALTTAIEASAGSEPHSQSCASWPSSKPRLLVGVIDAMGFIHVMATQEVKLWPIGIAFRLVWRVFAYMGAVVVT